MGIRSRGKQKSQTYIPDLVLLFLFPSTVKGNQTKKSNILLLITVSAPGRYACTQQWIFNGVVYQLW